MVHETPGMIRFHCKSCGKPHQRPDTQVGLTLFCDCGQSLRVPWTSTALPPETLPIEPIPTVLPLAPTEEEEIPEAIPVPRARALPVPEEDTDRKPRRESLPVPPGPPMADSLPSRKKRTIKRTNPAYCFNHEEQASETQCEDCKLSFCRACVVDFQHRTLCGPCKNFRLRPRSLPPRLSPRALVALVVGFVSGPLGFCLSTLPLTAHLQARGSVGLTIVAGLLALGPPLLACWLGRKALGQLEREPLLAGRGLAMTGALAGVLSVLWCLTISAVTLVKQFQG